jgi:hypothetical protein
MSHRSANDSALPVLRAWNFHGRVIILTINAQHTLNSTDHAANRAADNRADRASTPITLIDSVRDASRHALCLCSKRNSGDSNRYARKKNSELHQLSFPVLKPSTLL